MKITAQILAGVAIMSMMGRVQTQATVLFEVDANNDTDPNDGWNYTGSVGGDGVLAAETCEGRTEALERVQKLNGQHYFYRNRTEDRLFRDAVPDFSHGEYSFEIFINRDSSIDGLEDQILRWRNTGGSQNVGLAYDDVPPISEPGINHRSSNNE